jgi:L-fuculose-phosphate aldolase
MQFKKRIGIDDPRLHINDCDLCGPSVFSEGYGDFVPESYAFPRQGQEPTSYVDEQACECKTHEKPKVQVKDMDELVRIVTEKVMAALSETKA